MGLFLQVSALREILSGPGQRPQPPSVRTVVAWRNRLAGKYASQLGEPLQWDEDSTFVEAADADSGALLGLTFVAAVASGADAAALPKLSGMPVGPTMAASPAIGAAYVKGFAGPFPQLVLGASIWLPFSRNLILEEPDPVGEVRRFGSLPALVAQLDALRDRIAAADPKVVPLTADMPVNDRKVLAAAWQGAALYRKLASIAIDRRLPMILLT